MLTIYHNGECSKSKGALGLLIENDIQHQIRYYLTEPLGREELQTLLQKLGMKASSIVRKNEVLYQEHYEGKEITDDEWEEILVQNPQLIERPIIEKGDKAIVCRPPERVFEMIDK
jgi:arsenate reductase (glutaredoxin)